MGRWWRAANANRHTVTLGDTPVTRHASLPFSRTHERPLNAAIELEVFADTSAFSRVPGSRRWHWPPRARVRKRIQRGKFILRHFGQSCSQFGIHALQVPLRVRSRAGFAPSQIDAVVARGEIMYFDRDEAWARNAAFRWTSSDSEKSPGSPFWRFSGSRGPRSLRRSCTPPAPVPG